jgi:hypothetical protein
LKSGPECELNQPVVDEQQVGIGDDFICNSKQSLDRIPGEKPGRLKRYARESVRHETVLLWVVIDFEVCPQQVRLRIEIIRELGGEAKRVAIIDEEKVFRKRQQNFQMLAKAGYRFIAYVLIWSDSAVLDTRTKYLDRRVLGRQDDDGALMMLDEIEHRLYLMPVSGVAANRYSRVGIQHGLCL